MNLSAFLGVEANEILEEIPGVKVHQRGDSDERDDFEWTLLFSLQLFDEVAKIVRPRKRRKLSGKSWNRTGFGKRILHRFRQPTNRDNRIGVIESLLPNRD